MRNVIHFLCLLFFLPVMTASAQGGWFQPCIAVLAGAHGNQYDYSGSLNNDGSFLDDWGIHIGLSLTNTFHFRNNMFFQTGFRYLYYPLSVNYAYPSFVTQYGRLDYLDVGFEHETLSLPLWLGKTFDDGVRQWNIKAGLSACISMQSSLYKSGYGSHNSVTIKEGNQPQVSAPFFTLDFGGEVYPFTKQPGIGIGMLASVQLNRTVYPHQYQGVVIDMDNGEQMPFTINSDYREGITTSITLSYTFFSNKGDNRYKQAVRKQKKARRANHLSCPE